MSESFTGVGTIPPFSMLEIPISSMTHMKIATAISRAETYRIGEKKNQSLGSLEELDISPNETKIHVSMSDFAKRAS